MRMLWLGTALVGCAGGVGGPDVTEFVDEGSLCLRSDGSLLVDFGTCLSSSCDTLTDAECSASLDGNTITVTSYGRVETTGTTCTDDCGFATATCALPEAPDPSIVTVEHGITSVALSGIPGCETL